MIPITRPELPALEDYTALLERIWRSRMLSNFGEFSKELEALAGDYLEVPCRSVVSGDIGLVCAIAALDLPPGSTCVVPSFTFNSTINALLWNQLVPVFTDIDESTLNLDPDAAEAMLHESGASLVVATHVFGNPADAERLRRLAADNGARLLFDAAHGYGSIRDGVHVGGLGDVEVFSLSGTKPVTCAEGGLVTSHDEDLLRRVEYFRAYGFQGDYHSKFVGINGKISELHAALGTLTLAEIEPALEHRFRQLERYKTRLGAVDGIRFQRVREADRSTFKDFAVLFDSRAQRDAVRDALATADVQTKEYFRPCHTMDAYVPYTMRDLPVTERIYETILCLPLFAGLRDAELDSICEVVERTMAAAPAACP